jgi:hypothetical protein
LPPATRFGGPPDPFNDPHFRDQVYPSQLEALQAKILTLQQALFDREAVEQRQKRTLEEDRLTWEAGYRALERDSRELRARERAREAQDAERDSEVHALKAEVRSLMHELADKNREILALQRLTARVEVEAREKIIEHQGLIEQLKEQYQKVLKDREELTSQNAKHMIQAKLYVQEEIHNKELLEKINESSSEVSRLRAELYISTSKSMEQEKQLHEQAEIIKTCEIEVEKSKQNFISALRQASIAHEKERLTLVESHQHEVNRLLVRLRESESLGLGKFNGITTRSINLEKGAADSKESTPHSSNFGSKEVVTPSAANNMSQIERELRLLKEENIKFSVDIGFLKEEVIKKDQRILEYEEKIELLGRDMTDLKDQNIQKVRDCYSKEKMLNDMSQKYSEMMSKYTVMHKSLEAHEKEESQLRKELNEYHARLMRLSDEKTSSLEKPLNDPKNPCRTS